MRHTLIPTVNFARDRSLPIPSYKILWFSILNGFDLRLHFTGPHGFPHRKQEFNKGHGNTASLVVIAKESQIRSYYTRVMWVSSS